MCAIVTDGETMDVVSPVWLQSDAVCLKWMPHTHFVLTIETTELRDRANIATGLARQQMEIVAV